MEAAGEGAEELAAGIICSLRGADLAGWTPPWWPAPAARRDGKLIWPAEARGKRSRRRSPSASTSGKARWARASPASPLDFSASGSAASTSGAEDGAFCSPATKVEPIERTPMTFPTPPPRPTGQRPRKKMRLPEVQQLVRSLTVENESLRKEMRALQKACNVLSKENDKLETRLEQSSPHNEITSKEHKGKQQMDQQPNTQPPLDCFVLPDLNLPPQDTADVPSIH